MLESNVEVIRCGCRDTALTSNSLSSRCFTIRRPRKPVPPNTVISRRGTVQTRTHSERSGAPSRFRFPENARAVLGKLLIREGAGGAFDGLSTQRPSSLRSGGVQYRERAVL